MRARILRARRANGGISPSAASQSFAALPSKLRSRLKSFAAYRSRGDRQSLEITVAILRAQQEATLDGILVVDRAGHVLSCNRRFLEIWRIPPSVAEGGHDSQLLEYADALVADPDVFQRQVRHLYEHPQEVRSDDIVPLRDGRVLSRASVPVRSGDKVTGRAWYFRDVTGQVRAEKLRSALFRISEVALTARNLDEVYRSVHQIVGELMDATNFHIALYDEEMDVISFPYFVDQRDPSPASSKGERRGLASYVLRTGQPLLATPERFEELTRRGEVGPVDARSLGWLGVPLILEGRTIGVLSVQTYSESVRYSVKEMEILTFVSQHVASAIEHKRNQQELERSREYSETLINAANAMIAHLDASGRVAMLNDKAEQVTGFTLEELKGKRFFEEIRAETVEMPWWPVSPRGQLLPDNVEMTIRTSRGEHRQVSWHNSEVVADGAIVGTICIGIDVTNRHAADEAIRESENRYRQMFDNNPAVKLLIEPQTGRIEHANRAACTFYGYSLQELTSLRLSEIDVSGDQRLRYLMTRASSEQGSFVAFRHRVASGEVRDVEVHSGPVHVRGRTLLYSIVTDVTDRNKAESALAESEEKYRSIFRFATVCIYQADPSGRILTANESMARLLGYDGVDALLARNMGADIYMHSEDRQALLERYNDGQRNADVEALWKRKDGSPVWVQLNAHAVLDRVTGELLYYEGFAHDISERKLAEEMMRNQSAAFRASMDGIAILNERSELVYVNEAFAELFGYASSLDLIGRSWGVVYPESEYTRMMEDVMPRVLIQGSWRGEADGLRLDNTIFPQEISLTSLENGGVVCVARDTTERTVAEEQIRHLAYHDILTGLPNRLLFKDRLTVAISRAQRDQSRLAVLFLDLDDFKRVNDSLGHNAGDHLLQAVAGRIHACLRESDTVARFGGDEFTVLLPYLTNAEDAALIARKLLDAIRRPITVPDQNLFVTTSVGISIYPDDGKDTETLIKNADTAMYQAKSAGRDNYQLFNATISAHALERLALEQGLRQAIERDEFQVHYQPIYDVAAGQIRGMEALARWQHPDLGLLSPANFIPLAENLNLMGTIGRIILRKACLQLRDWQMQGFDQLTLATNISVSQLRQPDCVLGVAEILHESKVPPGTVELEITESGAMLNPEGMIETITNLKELGVKISLDDFGTGHSSLSYLNRFPIDTLKIDQSFVRDITAGDDTAGIVTAIIAMARTLKLRVIAEGVEREEQRLFLIENGCQLMQGFLFKRPIPAEEFRQVLVADRAL
jgi:diguanylate cyclase (GGDEF)-like protein/PAS domain S-box-containing protein